MLDERMRPLAEPSAASFFSPFLSNSLSPSLSVSRSPSLVLSAFFSPTIAWAFAKRE